MNPRDMDDLFKRLEELMNSDFSGGYMKPTENHSEEKEIIDITDDEQNVYITVDLRLDDDDISVTPKDKSIILEIMFDGSWKRKVIQLKYTVDRKTAVITSVNGVLDITLKKVKEVLNEI